MSKIDHIEPRYVDAIPTTLDSGIFYISLKYKTASHLCCSGCGNKVVTPLKPGGWNLVAKGGLVSLYPSIGNWRLPCRSHYWIRKNEIIWAGEWSEEDISESWAHDLSIREQHFNRSSEKGFLQRIFGWFF